MRPRSATSDAPQARRRFPGKWAAPPPGRAQEDRRHGNMSTKVGMSHSPPSLSAAQEDVSFFLLSNNISCRHVFGDVCTRASVSKCRCSHYQDLLKRGFYQSVGLFKQARSR